MVVTIYTEDDKYSFFDVKEFTVAGAMSITGTDEVDFGKQGFRFEDNDTRRTPDKEKQSADTN